MGYNNSAKAKMIRVAADEKDKKYASAAGKRALNKDINSMINYGSPNKNIGPQGLGAKGNNGYTIGSEGPLLKPKLGSHSIHKHMGGSAFKLVGQAQLQDTVQYVKDLQDDMPIDKDATGGRGTGTTGDPVMDAFHAKQKRRKEFEKAGGAKKAKIVQAEGASIIAPGPSNEIIKAKPTVKKTKREVKREDRKNERKAKRNARLDKKIARQTRKGKEAGDGAEKGIDSKALAKRRRVDKLKARKAKNNK